jgi:type IV pilus assembly protein PilC
MEGKNPKGRKVKGVMEAETSEQVKQSLQRRKITPDKIKKNQKTYLKILNFTAQG